MSRVALVAGSSARVRRPRVGFSQGDPRRGFLSPEQRLTDPPRIGSRLHRARGKALTQKMISLICYS
jgi:hypothetical protein